MPRYLITVEFDAEDRDEAHQTMESWADAVDAPRATCEPLTDPQSIAISAGDVQLALEVVISERDCCEGGDEADDEWSATLTALAGRMTQALESSES